jgi:hypothetical protein
MFNFPITWYKRVHVEPMKGNLEITNVINQTVVFGAK